MKAVKTNEPIEKIIPANDSNQLSAAISKSWSKIAPFWPLKNLIAANPLAGFEELPFEEALRQANAYFQQKELPKSMQHINRETIKWLQSFFDEGQSTIQMPMRHLGLLKCVLSFIRFDCNLHKNDPSKLKWLKQLPQNPKALIHEALLYLDIPAQEQEQFLTLMLTTLPGWAAYVQYRTNWADAQDSVHPYPVTQSEYLALRLVLTCLIWPDARQLFSWHQKALKNADVTNIYQKVTANEALYQKDLVKKLQILNAPKEKTRACAQLIFCIDVRSEPFRRALESQGNYETYGFAGFFGVPVSIENTVTDESYASCPVLLKPAHKVVEYPNCVRRSYKNRYKKLKSIKKLYRSLKYTFATPFSLVETVGIASGLWMALKSFAPRWSAIIQSTFKRVIIPDYKVKPDIQTIPFEQQVSYAANVLKIMGLTNEFAELVVLCGHGSTSQNNAYATALDCGACGGHHGAPNARILAAILNSKNVRKCLKEQNIEIPEDTSFIAAEHNTTTDEVELYDDNEKKPCALKIKSLQQDLQKARNANNLWRSKEMGIQTDIKYAKKLTDLRAKDWAQVRPEWGLARNASLIVGPRWLTQNIDLEGRSFLHSHEWEKDIDGASLTTILTAPMVVAQWINAQYFFSTLDNVAFGGGNKITKNVIGKIGIMQGNASDLMYGLPLQSVFKSDNKAYHQSLRLTVIVYAPQSHINSIIKQQSILQKLFGNGWVHMICYDPKTKQKYSLQRNLTWDRVD